VSTPVALQQGETMADAIERTAPDRRAAERTELLKISGIAPPARGVQGFGPQAVLGAGPRAGTNVSGHAVVPAPTPAAPAPVQFSDPASDSGPQMKSGIRVHDPARQELANRITSAYVALLPAKREAARAQYETELAAAFNGTHKYSSRGVTTVAAVVPDHLDPAKVAAAKAVIAANETGIPERFVPIAGADLSGYTLPAEVAAAGMTHLSPETIGQLRAARAAGITDAQVRAVMLADLAKP